MLNDPTYTSNVKKVSKHFQDQPEKPLTRAVWWVEYIIRNPTSEHLRSPVMDLGFLAANAYDIVIVATLVLALVMYLSMKAVCKVVRCFKKDTGVKKVKKN